MRMRDRITAPTSKRKLAEGQNGFVVDDNIENGIDYTCLV